LLLLLLRGVLVLHLAPVHLVGLVRCLGREPCKFFRDNPAVFASFARQREELGGSVAQSVRIVQ
jgi:hypothetical protein